MAKLPPKEITIPNETVVNDYLKRAAESELASTQLKNARPYVDDLVLGIFNKEGVEGKNRPDNFTIVTSGGKLGAELRKNKKNTKLSNEMVDFLKENKIPYDIEKTSVDFVINPDLKEKLIKNPELFENLSWVQDRDGTPLLEEVAQEEFQVANDQTIGGIYEWAANQPELPENLTKLINAVSTLAISADHGGVPLRMFDSRYEAMNADGEVYEHYKGGIYRVVDTLNNKGTTRIKYEHLWPHPHDYYEKTYEEFYGTVEQGGQQVPRFRKIEGS